MKTSLSDERPIFIQIAELIEDAILSGAYNEEDQVPSITELAVAYKINPATALKGINRLVDAQLLYKKRGMGMFVAGGARERISQSRRDQFYQIFIQPMLKEAERLEISTAELTDMLEKGRMNHGN
jgi:DNA-binding transcriptional regulator YhcF (GntR family)